MIVSDVLRFTRDLLKDDIHPNKSKFEDLEEYQSDRLEERNEYAIFHQFEDTTFWELFSISDGVEYIELVFKHGYFCLYDHYIESLEDNSNIDILISMDDIKNYSDDDTIDVLSYGREIMNKIHPHTENIIKIGMEYHQQ